MSRCLDCELYLARLVDTGAENVRLTQERDGARILRDSWQDAKELAEAENVRLRAELAEAVSWATELAHATSKGVLDWYSMFYQMRTRAERAEAERETLATALRFLLSESEDMFTALAVQGENEPTAITEARAALSSRCATCKGVGRLATFPVGTATACDACAGSGLSSFPSQPTEGWVPSAGPSGLKAPPPASVPAHEPIRGKPAFPERTEPQ